MRRAWAAILACACAGGSGAEGRRAGGPSAPPPAADVVELHPDALVEAGRGRIIIRVEGELEALELTTGRLLPGCDGCAGASPTAKQSTVVVEGVTLRIDRQAMPMPSGEMEEVSSIVATDADGRVRWRRELERRRLRR